jgi:hypothetical protein
MVDELPPELRKSLTLMVPGMLLKPLMKMATEESTPTGSSQE